MTSASGRTTTWLIDTSAYVRLGESPDAETWAERIDRGQVRITTVTRLELGYSARSAADWRSELHGPLQAGRPVQYLTPTMEDRVVEVQLLLADRGYHRSPSVSDLIVSAAAELGGLTLLHFDKDFELIAEVTGQPMERLATSPDETTQEPTTTS